VCQISRKNVFVFSKRTIKNIHTEVNQYNKLLPHLYSRLNVNIFGKNCFLNLYALLLPRSCAHSYIVIGHLDIITYIFTSYVKYHKSYVVKINCYD